MTDWQPLHKLHNLTRDQIDDQIVTAVCDANSIVCYKCGCITSDQGVMLCQHHAGYEQGARDCDLLRVAHDCEYCS